MKPDSRDLCNTRKAHSTQHTAHRTQRLLLSAVCCLLSAGVLGCESVQRKFIRKRKEAPRPSPIVQFRDYREAMDALERYRKHFVLFQYWNGELLRSLGSGMSLKAARHVSGEALQELRTLRGLLTEPAGASLDPMIAQRQQIHERLMNGTYMPSQPGPLRQTLDTQTRLIYRDFTWRDVQERLHVAPAAPAAPAATADGPNADGH